MRERIAVNSGVAVSVAVLAVLLVPASQASSAPSDCVQTGLHVECTFKATGDPESWQVPPSVTTATFDLYGAQGGNGRTQSFTFPGGKGGRATLTMPVSAGTTYDVRVGQHPADFGDSGGFGGGGNSTAPAGAGFGAGGGASDIRFGGIALTNRILVAGGGGGTIPAKNGHGGAGGGLTGADADTRNVSGGGGNQSAGGQGGRSPLDNGEDGALGVGGNAGTVRFGGGGGGGYYGGGGGSNGFGGGGGSGTGPAGTAFESGVRTGDGLVVISYDLQEPVLTLVTQVDHGGSGGTIPPEAWTLTAAGLVTVTGKSGSQSVTNVPVPAGSYNLSATGPAGFTASDWNCGAYPVANGSIALAYGDQVTCTIVNTAIPPEPVPTPPAPTPPVPDSAPPVLTAAALAGASGGLAVTGWDSAPAVAVAMGLLALGAAIGIISWRRRSAAGRRSRD